MPGMTQAPEGGAPLIVVGDDGSAMSDRVWQWLTSHSWPGWRVEVMTADQTEIVWGEPARSTQWTPPWARATPVEGVESVTYLKFPGDPRPMLGERNDGDLIVVGRNSRDPQGRLALGGTSEWLLHHPPAPLAVIGGSGPVGSVTVCADGSGHSRAAIDAFASWPLAAGVGVTVLAVADGRSDAEAAAASGVEALAGKVASVASMVIKDAPTPAILRHVEATRPDLVVLGTKGLTGWKRLRVGSTAGAVVRGTSCNALVASTGEP